MAGGHGGHGGLAPPRALAAERHGEICAVACDACVRMKAKKKWGGGMEARAGAPRLARPSHRRRNRTAGPSSPTSFEGWYRRPAASHPCDRRLGRTPLYTVAVDAVAPVVGFLPFAFAVFLSALQHARPARRECPRPCRHQRRRRAACAATAASAVGPTATLSTRKAASSMAPPLAPPITPAPARHRPQTTAPRSPEVRGRVRATDSLAFPFFLLFFFKRR